MASVICRWASKKMNRMDKTTLGRRSSGLCQNWRFLFSGRNSSVHYVHPSQPISVAFHPTSSSGFSKRLSPELQESPSSILKLTCWFRINNHVCKLENGRPSVLHCLLPHLPWTHISSRPPITACQVPMINSFSQLPYPQSNRCAFGFARKWDNHG